MNDVPQEKPVAKPQVEQPKAPEFQPAWFWAFASLMLYKLGGVEAVSVERLEQFDETELPEVIYDHDRKAFVMKLKDKDMPKKLIVVPVSGKILKRQRKILTGVLS